MSDPDSQRYEEIGKRIGDGLAETRENAALIPSLDQKLDAVNQRIEAVAERIEAVAERIEAVAEWTQAVAQRIDALNDLLDSGKRVKRRKKS